MSSTMKMMMSQPNVFIEKASWFSITTQKYTKCSTNTRMLSTSTTNLFSSSGIMPAKEERKGKTKAQSPSWDTRLSNQKETSMFFLVKWKFWSVK